MGKVMDAGVLLMSVDNKLDEYPASPVTTPGSVVDEERFLVPFLISKKPKWYSKHLLPFGILTASLLEIIFFLFSNEPVQKLLRFEPYNLKQLWRFLTYMLLHEDLVHLLLNVMMQIIFAYFLENRHGHYKILFLYLIGGISGVLGASCVHPDLVIGASAGVYALLISHVSDILMNYESLQYKLYRCFCITIIVISDIAFNLIHILSRDEPLISWGAHFVGGVTGFFIGLVMYYNDGNHNKFRKRLLFWTGIIFYIILMIILVILNLQIKKCTPYNVIRTRYIYFC